MTFIRCLLTAAALTLCAAVASADGPKRLLILQQGPDGHAATTHEYVAGVKIIQKCLDKVPDLEIKIASADEPFRDGPELLEKADGVVLYLAEGAKWLMNDARRHAAFKKLAARGGGMVALHWAIGTKEANNIDGFVELFGGCHGGPDRKMKIVQANVTVADSKHPIATAVKDFAVRDEFYYQLKFVKPAATAKPLLKATIDGQVETVAWTWERPDGGRSFGYSGLHFHDNWSMTECRRLVAQSILWTLKLPIPKEGLPVRITAEDIKLVK